VCQSRLLVCPIPGSHRLKATAKTAEILRRLRENMDAGKIELSSEDVQAVGEVTDKANAAQSDRLYPENHMKGMVVNLYTVRLPYHELKLPHVPERRSLDQGRRRPMDILYTRGRALRSSGQHRSTVLHRSLLKPRCFAPSGFFGRTPSMISLTTIMSHWIST
jgi:hypothetical protein